MKCIPYNVLFIKESVSAPFLPCCLNPFVNFNFTVIYHCKVTRDIMAPAYLLLLQLGDLYRVKPIYKALCMTVQCLPINISFSLTPSYSFAVCYTQISIEK